MSLKNLFWKRSEIKNKGNPPNVEPGQSLVYLTDRNKYLLFGGLNQKQSQQNQDKEDKPKSNTGLKFSINNKPSIGGGLKFSIGNNQANNNLQDLVYILDPADYQWSEIKCTGKIPQKRTNCYSWYESPYYFIYGGQTTNNKILNDMYVLNVDNYEWKRFFWLEGPSPRIDCQLINMGSNKYIIGGSSMPENWVLDDIWSFNLENVVWSSSQKELPGIQWRQLQLQENLFQPLKAFAALHVSERQIFIFGGYNQEKQCTATSILFDVEDQSIVEFETKGTKPGPRAYHQMIHIKENLICLFGGVSCPEASMKGSTSIMLNDFYILNLKEGYWTRPTTGGYLPSPRYHFSIAGNQNEMANEIILLGGLSHESLCDKYVYVLGEIVQDEQEYWAQRNEQSKQQYECYREAIKNNKKKTESLKNVSITTLELSQAEKVISEQKRKIGDLETLFKKIKNENEDKIKSIRNFEEDIKDNRKKLDEKCNDTIKEIEEKEIKNSELKDFVGQLQTLLAYERKKRKLLQFKSFQLQDSMRKSENLIISIDQVYNRGHKEDLVEGILTEDALKKIERKKTEHKKQLVLFRDDLESIYNNEKKIQEEISQRKELLKPDIDISEDWKRFLSPDEQRMFSQQGK